MITKLNVQYLVIYTNYETERTVSLIRKFTL